MDALTGFGDSPGKRALTPFLLTPSPLSALPLNARIGTASARRQSWIRHFRPDLEIASLRGNVPTRLRRLADGGYDAILLAGAGIERLLEASDVLDGAMASIERERLDPDVFVPAPAQGALAVQCREDAKAVRDALAAIDDEATHAAVRLERKALALAEGGCNTAFGARAVPAGDGLALTVMLERDGSVVRARMEGRANDELAARALAALASREERIG